MALNRLAQHAAAASAARATPPEGTLLLRKSASRSGPEGECDECAKLGTMVQRKAAGSASPGTAPAIVHAVLASAGQPLDSATRAFMEPRLGHDFSKVRVHTDEHAARSAGAVNSLAYTVGPHIAFAAGQYRPQTESGRRLLAHELTHVVQQRDSGTPSADLRVSRHDDAAEVEAAHAEESVLEGEPFAPAQAALALSRQDAGTDAPASGGGDGGAGGTDAGSGATDAGAGGSDAGTGSSGGTGTSGGAAPAAPPAGGGGTPAATPPHVIRVEVENSAEAITYPVPSNRGAAGRQHWVTIAGTRPDVVVRAVLDTPIPETDPQVAGLTWESDPPGAVGPGTGPLHGVLDVPTARKRVVRAVLGASHAEMTLWGVFVQVSTAGPTSPPTAVRQPARLDVSTHIDFTGRIFPASIITDADRPDLAGANTVNPTGTNICGNALAGGMDHRWDMSRQRRLNNLDPAGLLPAIGVAAPPACLDTAGAFPAAPESGNDDSSTADENNDPYAGGGVITSHDDPIRNYPDTVGADGDTLEQRLQFREFARLEFHRTIWTVSHFSPWRIHYRIRKVAGQWQDNGSTATADNAGF